MSHDWNVEPLWPRHWWSFNLFIFFQSKTRDRSLYFDDREGEHPTDPVSWPRPWCWCSAKAGPSPPVRARPGHHSLLQTTSTLQPHILQILSLAEQINVSLLINVRTSGQADRLSVYWQSFMKHFITIYYDQLFGAEADSAALTILFILAAESTYPSPLFLEWTILPATLTSHIWLAGTLLVLMMISPSSTSILWLTSRLMKSTRCLVSCLRAGLYWT